MISLTFWHTSKFLPLTECCCPAAAPELFRCVLIGDWQREKWDKLLIGVIHFVIATDVGAEKRKKPNKQENTRELSTFLRLIGSEVTFQQDLQRCALLKLFRCGRLSTARLSQREHHYINFRCRRRNVATERRVFFSAVSQTVILMQSWLCWFWICRNHSR